MAASQVSEQKTVGYTQYPIKVQCDVCNTETDVKLYCTECVKNMCEKCKQYHDKFYIDHKMMSAFEGRIIKHLETKCKIHDLVFSCHCMSCQINICYKCQGGSHKNCMSIDIDKHAEILKIPFLKTVDKQRQHLPEIDKKIHSINDNLANFDKIIDSQIATVETETEKRHKELDIKKSDIIKKLKSQQDSAHKKIHEQIKFLQDLRTSIDDITTSITTQIDLVSDAGILQLVNECNTELDYTSIKTTFDLPSPSIFAPSSLSGQGNNTLGSLQNTNSTSLMIDTRIDPSDTSKYLPDTESPSPIQSLHYSTPADPSPSLRHEISVVHQLSVGDYVNSCTSDGSRCWVGLYRTVELYNQRGDQLLSVDLSHGTEYTALTTTGELLVSGYSTTVISRVNKAGHVCKFTDISARGVQYVTGLVTTRQDDVFVCVRMKGKTKDKVLTFSARGKKISELNSHFFTSTKLYGIHAVSCDTFCLQDGRGREGGRLVFVDGGSQLVRHIDRTTSELQSDIRTVAGDRHGHLIIATFGSEYIHVLSGEDTCKRTYHIQGSREVGGVSVGEDDVLWIGTGLTGELIVAKYLE